MNLRLLSLMLALSALPLAASAETSEEKKEHEQAVQAALDAFKTAFKGGDLEKAEAVKLLKDLRDRKILDALGKIILDPGPKTRIEASKLLADFEKDRDAAAVIVRALPVPPKNPDVQIAFLDALGAIRDWGSAAAVIDRFNDSDMNVAAAAMRASGRIRNPSAVKKLIDVLQERRRRDVDRETALNQAARQALAAITGRAGDAGAAAGGKQKRAPATAMTNWHEWWRDNEAAVTARLQEEERAELEALARRNGPQ